MKNLSLRKRFMYYSGILIASLGGEVIEDLTHISDLLDAEHEGKILKLPCKIGDKFYKIIQGEIFELRLDEIRRNRSIEGAVTLCCEVEGKRWDRRYIDSNAQTFRTRAAAEKALKEMRKKVE